jgi:hypothetical protein
MPAEIIADGIVLLKAEVNGHPGRFILDNTSPGMPPVNAPPGRTSIIGLGICTHAQVWRQRWPARGGPSTGA